MCHAAILPPYAQCGGINNAPTPAQSADAPWNTTQCSQDFQCLSNTNPWFYQVSPAYQILPCRRPCLTRGCNCYSCLTRAALLPSTTKQHHCGTTLAALLWDAGGVQLAQELDIRYGAAGGITQRSGGPLCMCSVCLCRRVSTRPAWQSTCPSPLPWRPSSTRTPPARATSPPTASAAALRAAATEQTAWCALLACTHSTPVFVAPFEGGSYASCNGPTVLWNTLFRGLPILPPLIAAHHPMPLQPWQATCMLW